jgi:hypothetical protein
MRRVRPAQPLVWLELRLVEPMPAAVRTRSQGGLRQEKIELKNFACNFRLDANSGKAALS